MNERIKLIRRELGLTQTEFAERIGLKQNSIALIESGKRNISDQAVLSICREYGVNEEWLRTGTGEKMTPGASDELEALVKKYDLSHGEYIFLEKYLKLKREERDNAFDFIMDVCSAIRDSDVSGTADAAPGSSIPDIDIDAEVEAYRQQLELQKKAEPILNAAHDMGATEEEKQRADDIMMNDDEWK